MISIDSGLIAFLALVSVIAIFLLLGFKILTTAKPLPDGERPEHEIIFMGDEDDPEYWQCRCGFEGFSVDEAEDHMTVILTLREITARMRMEY